MILFVIKVFLIKMIPMILILYSFSFLQMRVFEVASSRVHKIFNKGSSLSSISLNDLIFV